MRLPRPITSFPGKYKFLNQEVAKLHLIHAISPDDYDPKDKAEVEKMRAEGINIDEDYRACDLILTMKNGKSYGFMPCTPEYIRDYLDREQERTFVVPGILPVSELTLETILEALEDCIERAPHYHMESFGHFMTSGSHDDE